MPSVYQDFTSIPGESPVMLSIPADTGRLKAVCARTMGPLTPVNQAFIQIILADATRQPPTPKAVLTASALGGTQYIGWTGDLPLESNDVIYAFVWSQYANPYRVFVLTEV